MFCVFSKSLIYFALNVKLGIIFGILFQEIEQKTSELLNNLKSLCETGDDGKKYLTLESLKQRKMAPATENFLFSLAACEGLVKL